MMTPPNANFVAMKGVRLIYGRGSGTHALEDLDLNVGQGEFAAVVGPSGCGKSSLMKLVTGLLPPTSGVIEVGGKQVDGPLNIAGMAFQNPTLLPWRQTLSNVLLPFEIVEQHRYRIRRDRTEY